MKRSTNLIAEDLNLAITPVEGDFIVLAVVCINLYMERQSFDSFLIREIGRQALDGYAYLKEEDFFV